MFFRLFFTRIPSRTAHRFLSGSVLLALVVFVVGCGQKQDVPRVPPEDGTAAADSESLPYEHSELDFPVPEFTFERMNGETITSADLKGKITVINFWATWCGPCVYEIPELVVLHDDWKNRDFEIIGVSMDDDFEIVRPFAEEFAINYPVVIDSGELADQFRGVFALPTTFIVDENGKVTDRFIGVFPAHEWRDELDTRLRSLE